MPDALLLAVLLASRFQTQLEKVIQLDFHSGSLLINS